MGKPTQSSSEQISRLSTSSTGKERVTTVGEASDAGWRFFFTEKDDSIDGVLRFVSPRR